MKSRFLLICIVCLFHNMVAFGQSRSEEDFAVIAYYPGNGEDLERYRWSEITHVIYSFCHLDGNELAVDNREDSLAIVNLVNLKKTHPKLKVLLSLGGWGGCKTCSPVFATLEGRQTFAKSVKVLMDDFGADGLDLDWEYPGIEGVPDHPFMPEDKQNFTFLVHEIRKTIGDDAILSFAAGGFQSYFDHSIEWNKVMQVVDYVNLMSYDLVSGYSTVTGHHTPLYSSAEQERSADFGVQYLLGLGVPEEKIVIGAAFYARVWEEVEDINDGLYRSGRFKASVPYKHFESRLNEENGFKFFMDEKAQAPYAYNPKLKQFATFDNPLSIRAKTTYALEKNLGGIMFWELSLDTDDGELLKTITETREGF